eukprot:Nk52_evm54s1401 gene=Nk52_evmTU54s1401
MGVKVNVKKNEDANPYQLPSYDGVKIEYPQSLDERELFRARPTPNEPPKKVTPFRWRVFDAILKIPAGRVTTYKLLAAYLRSSPRAVGQGLRRNPFAPWVPCHRVVSNDLYIGGFCGTWGSGDKINRKLELLKNEGVKFNESGFIDLKSCGKRESVIFDFSEEEPI